MFKDATALAARRKVIEANKLKAKAEKDKKLSINSMKREIKDLKKLVYDLLEEKAG